MLGVRDIGNDHREFAFKLADVQMKEKSCCLTQLDCGCDGVVKSRLKRHCGQLKKATSVPLGA